LSLPMMLLWYVLSSYVYVWFGTASQVVVLGEDYVQMLTWMLPFVMVKLVFVTALNAAGDTKTPMYIKIASIFLNVFLNYLFIFGNFGFPELGVMGAAVGTVIVNILELCVYLYLYVKNKMPYIPLWHYSTSLMKRAIRVGVPASFERTLTFGSFMLFTVIITQYGTEVLAGYQIGLRVEEVWLLCQALGLRLQLWHLWDRD